MKFASIACMLLASVSLTTAQSPVWPAKGAAAPALNPTGWLNTDAPVSWERLTGRLLLVEKWATW